MNDKGYDMFSTTIEKEKGDYYLTVEKLNGNSDDAVIIVKHATIGDRFMSLGFKTRTKAKACAVFLNKKYWKVYKEKNMHAPSLGMIADAMVKDIEHYM